MSALHTAFSSSSSSLSRPPQVNGHHQNLHLTSSSSPPASVFSSSSSSTFSSSSIAPVSDKKQSILEALREAQKEIARKRALESESASSSQVKKHKPSSSSSSSSSSHKKSHTSNRDKQDRAKRQAHILDVLQSSKAELEAKAAQKKKREEAQSQDSHSRFISEHWDDDEYEGMADHERRDALEKRWALIPAQTKAKWEEKYERERKEQEHHEPHPPPPSRPRGRPPPPSSSSSPSSAPVVPSFIPPVSKHSRLFMHHDFPLSRVRDVLKCLSMTSKVLSREAQFTLVRSTELFVQYLTSLLVQHCEESKSTVLKPEDLVAVMVRREELQWMRWAFEGDELMAKRYRGGWMAMHEKKKLGLGMKGGEGEGGLKVEGRDGGEGAEGGEGGEGDEEKMEVDGHGGGEGESEGEEGGEGEEDEEEGEDEGESGGVGREDSEEISRDSEMGADGEQNGEDQESEPGGAG